MKIRAVRIHNNKVPHFVRTRCEKDLFPVGRPAWVIRIVAWGILKDVHLTSRDVYYSDVTHVSRVARFFDGVKRDASSIRRDRRENSVGDFSFAGAV